MPITSTKNRRLSSGVGVRSSACAMRARSCRGSAIDATLTRARPGGEVRQQGCARGRAARLDPETEEELAHGLHLVDPAGRVGVAARDEALEQWAPDHLRDLVLDPRRVPRRLGRLEAL